MMHSRAKGNVCCLSDSSRSNSQIKTDSGVRRANRPQIHVVYRCRANRAHAWLSRMVMDTSVFASARALYHAVESLAGGFELCSNRKSWYRLHLNQFPIDGLSTNFLHVSQRRIENEPPAFPCR
jgi:hypothetical protein